MAKADTRHKYSDIVEQITGDRLEPYGDVAEIEYIIQKGYAKNSQEALSVSDIYVTLSQCREIVSNDIDRKIQETISNMK